MAHIQEVMATGVTSTLARMLGSNRLRTVVAQGSSQDDATPLISNFCLLACPVPGQGVRLNRAREAAITALFAIGPDSVLIYPAEDEAINNLLPNQPVALQPGSALMAVPSRDHWLMVLSAAEGGIADAPADGGPWAREGGEWIELPPPLPDAPTNGVLYGRQDASWQPVVGGGGGGGVAGVTAGTGLLVNGSPGATITSVGVMALDVPVSVAHGGTAVAAPGGQALDNISGLSGIGFIERTGTAVYGVIADPLPVAKGGTASSTPGGHALDNISGLTGTGFIERTGGAAYTVVADPLPVPKGGTAANAPGGQALDNITGFNTTGFIQRIGAATYSLVPSLPGVSSITAAGGLAANGVAGGSITGTGTITVAAGPAGAVLGFGAGGVAAPSAALGAGRLLEGGGTTPPTASAAWSEDANHSLAGNLNSGAVPGSISSDAGLYIAGATGNTPALTGDGFGASGLRLVGRRSEGTPALPTPPLDGLALTSITARGYTGGGYGTVDQAAVVLSAAQNWGVGVNATRIRSNVTPIGTTTLIQATMIEPDGTLYVGSSLSSTANNTGPGTINVAADYYRANVRLGLANGMGDVTIASPASGDLLTYNSGAGKWVNSPATGGGGGTVTHTAGPLTDQAVMLGNAGADAAVSATWSEDVNRTLAANFNAGAVPGSNSADPGVYLAGPNGVGPTFSGDGFGITGARLIGRRADGTAASPSAPGDGVAIAAMVARGYSGGAWGTTDQGAVVITAGQLWGSGANATRVRFNITPIGSTTLTLAAAVEPDGTLYVGSNISSTANNTGPGTINVAADYYRANVKLGLAAMGDVAIGSPAANDVLTWSPGAGKWVNLPPATGGGGTVTHISGNLTAQAMMLGNSGADAKVSATWSEDANKTLAANLNTGAAPGSNSADPGLYLAGPDGVGPAVTGDGFGITGARLIGRRANGTLASPSPPGDGVALASFVGRGYSAGAWGTTDQGGVVITAGQLWGSGANATRVRTNVTPIGSTTLILATAVEPDGTLYVGSNISSTANNTGPGTVNVDTGFFVGTTPLRNVSETLTNKTISGASNTLSAIGNASLANSSMTIAGNAVSLGGTLAAATLTASLNAMVGANGVAGTKGLVPAPSTGDAAAGRFLKADGTWASPAGGGNVSAVGTLTANQIVIGSGSTGVQALGSTGTAIQVLHGNAGGAPSFGAVSLTTDVSGTLQAAQHPALAGDVTSVAGSLTTTLPNVNLNVGTFQGLTLNAKGQVIAAANQSYLTTNQSITISGDVAGSGTTAITATLPNVNLNVGTFQGLQVNAKGQVTAAVNINAVTHSAGALTAGAVMLGNGGADAKVSAVWTEDANHTLSANLNGGAVPGANSADAGLYIAGPDGSGASVSGDGFGFTGIRLVGRRANGSLATSLTPPSDGVAITALNARGYVSGAWSTVDQGSVSLTTAELWAPGANGTRTRFNVTPRGSTTLILAGALEADGTLYVGSNISSTANNTGPGTVNVDTGFFVGTTPLRNVSETLTNKTISGASNTLSAIGNASLANSSMTIAGNAVSLGGTLAAATLTASLNAMVGANGVAGTKGLVPAPSTGDAAAGRFLKADGTWASPAGGGNVSAGGSLTANQIVIGSGSTGVQALGSTGTAIQVLHGNAGGAPSFGAVSLTTDVSGTLQAAQHPALAGDVTSVAGSLTTTLPNVNLNVGTFQGLTLNAKGQVIAAANQSYLTTNQSITLTGDVSGSGATLITVTLAAVANSKLANMPAHTHKGNNAGSSGPPLDLTAAQVVADLNAVTHSAGALTSGAMVLGNAGGDAKVSTVWTEDANHTLAANLNGGAVPGAASADAGLYIAGPDGSGAAISGDGFGFTGMRLVGRRANGSLATSLTPPADGVAITALNARGYVSGAWGTVDQGSISLTTAELWAPGANGTRTRFNVTPRGSTTLILAGAVEADGTLYVGSNTSSTANNTGPGTVNVDTGFFVGTVPLRNVSETLTNKSIATTQLTGTLQAAQHPALAGDVTSVAGSLTTTLPTVNGNVGTFQGLTVNGKGQVTAAVAQVRAVFNDITTVSPTGTSSTTEVMMGLAGVITPTLTGRVLFIVSGTLQNDTAGASVTVKLRYGTGTAPINGAAVPGTSVLVSTAITTKSAAASERHSFCRQGIVVSLTLGTPVWYDLGLNTVTGGIGSALGVNGQAIEI